MLTENWGCIPYALSWERQRHYVNEIASGRRPETVVLCSHPPVVTLGKQGRGEDIMGQKGEVHRVERGGRATYHGPGQVVCYPLIKVDKKGLGIGGFLQALEGALVETLAYYGVEGVGNPRRGDASRTGVWEKTSGKKLASIGVAVKRWVSFHGLALNLHHDPLAFQGLRPCGHDAATMTYLEELTEKKISRPECERRLLDALLPLLEGSQHQ